MPFDPIDDYIFEIYRLHMEEQFSPPIRCSDILIPDYDWIPMEIILDEEWVDL